MLTGDLVRVRVKQGKITPTWVRVDRKELLAAVDLLLGVFAQASESSWTRKQLKTAADAVVQGHRSHKVLRGCIKLLMDRCEFDADGAVSPAEIRAKAFRLAAKNGPLGLENNVFGRPTADDILEEVARELESSLEDTRRGLYADLKEAQSITRYRPPADAGALLHRYNVALVQAVLLKSTEVRITLHKPSVPRVRQLFRHIKFRQLMHQAVREEELLHVLLNGPASILQRTTRYGMQLASFFPALLLQEGPWELEAQVVWGRDRRPATLSVTHEQGLRSHLQDTGLWQPDEVKWFFERWAASSPDGWTLSSDTEPIDLDGKRVMLPDATFEAEGRRAHLEIVGYWRKDYLARRVEALSAYGPANLILAVSKNLGTEKGPLAKFSGEVIPFSKIVPVRDVVAALERVAQ